ncbi:MAG: histidine--tRNA ligase [Acidimicrobiales bacterium]
MADKPSASRAPRGTHDVLWPESTRWESLLSLFAVQVERAGYGLTVTPTFEDVQVFRRGIGEGSEVVGKEMYEFEDREGRALALRPEGTAPMVRAFVQHRPTLPWKAWYATAAFRYERPQRGRYREHHQVGVEALGPADPDLDVEVISLAAGFFTALGLSAASLRLNSMGDETCRPAYLELLRESLFERRDTLCPEHLERIDSNPLRVLDCKRKECIEATKDAPALADHLCDACRAHFDRVREGLEALRIRYELDHRLVRGFDYYTRTTFEFSADALESAQNGIGGGGRYDRLVEMLGGPPTPGIGFGIGIERVLLACDAEGVFPVAPTPLDAFVVDVVGGSIARDLTAQLRAAGFRADRAFDDRTMKAQLRAADHSGARVALIVGPDEVAEGTVSLKPLRGGGEQRIVQTADVVEAVRAATAAAGASGTEPTAEPIAEPTTTEKEHR